MPPKNWGHLWGQRPRKEHIPPPICRPLPTALSCPHSHRPFVRLRVFSGLLPLFGEKGGTSPILWWYRIHQSRYRNPCMFGKWFDSIVQYNTVQKILAVFFCTVFYCSFTCQTCRDFSEHLGKYLGLRARVKCVTPFYVCGCIPANEQKMKK